MPRKTKASTRRAADNDYSADLVITTLKEDDYLNKTRVNLLWTGGWDSTYRLVELSRMDVVVQPIYVTGMERPSEEIEIKAQIEILETLKNKKETIAEIRPVLFIKESEIPKNDKITKAYEDIQKKVALGIQYVTLAQCAAMFDMVEIGSEGGLEQNLRMTEAINLCGELIPFEDTYIMNPETANETGKYAFSHFSFPIIDKTEAQMAENIKKWGYEDVMSHVWFCHKPINGKQCGLCRACEVKMLNDMEWLVTPEAQKRFRVRWFLWQHFGKRFADAVCNRVYRPKGWKEE